jgi:hypothetical protein
MLTNREFKDVSKSPDAAPIEGVVLVRIDEVLTFASILDAPPPHSLSLPFFIYILLLRMMTIARYG